MGMSMPPRLLRALHRRHGKRANLIKSNIQQKRTPRLQLSAFLSEKEEMARTNMKNKGKVEGKNGPQSEGTGQESPDAQAVPQSYTSTVVGQVKMRPGEQSATEGYYPSLGYDNESPECSEMLDRLAGGCMMKAMLS